MCVCGMASILLSESDPDVQQLLVLLLERLGHEAIVLGGGADVPPPADLLLLEPASPRCVEEARLARLLDPTLPVVCVSILPREARFLELGPLAYLEKPFTSAALADAIDRALAQLPEENPAMPVPQRSRPINEATASTGRA